MKVAECVPYEDSDSIAYDDYEWSTDEFEWKKTGDEEPVETKKSDMEVPF